MKGFSKPILVSSLAIFSLCSNVIAQQRIPRFEDYPVRERFTGDPAPVKLTSREARMYRTVLREGAKEGPNFAGHYTIVGWGCGTACMRFAVVNAKTGDVYIPRFGLYNGLVEMPRGFEQGIEQQYRKESRLLIVYGLNGKGIHYFTWNGKDFKKVRSIY